MTMLNPDIKARELDSRTDGSTVVVMYYHGADATPKLTIEVSTDGEPFELHPTDENCMDMFNHPYAYMNQSSTPGQFKAA